MSTPGGEFVEVFLQEASEHLQFLREYSGILQDPYPVPEDVERLYISAHTLTGTSATYGYPLFSEVAGKLAHIFQYAMNATIGADASGPLVEFISEAIAVLESDLLLISANAVEAVEEINAFKEKYPFAFQAPVAEAAESMETAAAEVEGPSSPPPEPAVEELPQDAEVGQEILEFFVPEAEEHLQVVTECLLSLEANPNVEDIHKLFRAMHTLKGAAAQVGLHRIAHVAHHAEDLIGRLRDGVLRPSAGIVDICLEAVDTLKKFLYRQWPDETAMREATRSLLLRIARLAPQETAEMPVAPPAPATEAVAPAVEAPAEAPAEVGPAAPPAPAEAAAPPALVEAPAEPELAEALPGKRELAAMPQSKSVRVALERLDRMMNAVGELVINRTRMLGRLAELERLADVLNFSKARMTDKVAEFQEKYEFSNLTGRAIPAPRAPEPYPFRGGYSSYSHSYDASLAEFSELEMDRYD